MAELAKLAFPVGGKMIAKDEQKKAAARYATTKKPAVAALPDEEELRRKSRKEAALRFGSRGSGRASTILSSDEGKLGA